MTGFTETVKLRVIVKLWRYGNDGNDTAKEEQLSVKDVFIGPRMYILSSSESLLNGQKNAHKSTEDSNGYSSEPSVLLPSIRYSYETWKI